MNWAWWTMSSLATRIRHGPVHTAAQTWKLEFASNLRRVRLRCKRTPVEIICASDLGVADGNWAGAVDY